MLNVSHEDVEGEQVMTCLLVLFQSLTGETYKEKPQNVSHRNQCQGRVSKRGPPEHRRYC
jgi:hypothetical protein